MSDARLTPMRRPVVATGLLLLLATACEAEQPTPQHPQAIPTACGLPTPVPGLNASLVPAVWVEAADGELTNAERDKGGFLAAVNVPASVNEAFEIYKRTVTAEGYEILSEDNEGFEAEIYLRDGRKIGAIQIRMSRCESASLVYVNVVAQPRRASG